MSNFHKRIYRSEIHQIGEIAFRLNFKAIRKIYLFVKKPDGAIIVNAPRQAPLKTITDFISSKIDWITKARQRVLAKNPQESLKFDAGTMIRLFDEELELEVEFGAKLPKFFIKNSEPSENFTNHKFLASFDDANTANSRLQDSDDDLRRHFSISNPDFSRRSSAQLSFDFDGFNSDSILSAKTSEVLKKKRLILKTSFDASEVAKKLALDKFYRLELMKNLQELVKKWEKIIAVKSNFVGVKKMKTRHGSCNTRHARIWFALDLAKKPLLAVEYVVVHELVHLLEASHNRRFVALMTKFLPDWQSRKKLL